MIFRVAAWCALVAALFVVVGAVDEFERALERFSKQAEVRPYFPSHENLSLRETLNCFDFAMEAVSLKRAIDQCNYQEMYRIIEICHFPLGKPIYGEYPALAYAVSSGNINVLPELISLLNRNGYSVNRPFISVNILSYPLAFAQDKAMFDALVAAGADVNLLIQDYNTGNLFNFLHLAILNNNRSIVDGLLKAGIDATQRTSTGFTPMDLVDRMDQMLTTKHQREANLAIRALLLGIQ